MMGWETRILGIVDNEHFRVADAGPLHVPVHRFSLRRNDERNLILETEGPGNATSITTEYPAGTLRVSTEKVELINIAGAKVILSGVEPYSYLRNEGHFANIFKESARVHELRLASPEMGQAAYCIEWLENLPDGGLVWPDFVKTVEETKISHRLAVNDDGIGIEFSDGSSFERSSRSAVRLTVAGHSLFFCDLDPRDLGAGVRPGCIVYDGRPDDLVRKKIRTALSLAFGSCLIELGHTIYDEESNIVSATLQSAYSPDGKGGRPAMPLAPVSDGRSLNIVDRSTLSRMVNAFVNDYEKLDLGNLSWAYWHACAATVHIAPAHFGAAIEALQRAYTRDQSMASEILDRTTWKELRQCFTASIEGLAISDVCKRALREKLTEINRWPQRTVLNNVAQTIGVEVGNAESTAWARRNHAAHGISVLEGEELAAIRDTKLLRVLFNRLLLGSTNASEIYIDYASLGHPYRALREPVPS